MNELYKKILFGVLSVGVLAAAYFLLAKPITEETKSIENETANLVTYYNDLLSKEVNRQQYLDDTEAYYTMYDEKLDEFPSNLNQEYQIEFIQGIRNNESIDYDVDSQGMAQEVEFYSLSGSNSEGSLEGDSEVPSGLECYSSSMTLSYYGSYKGVKAFMDYVASYPYRMTIDTVSLVRDETSADLFTGNMTVNIFCVKGEGREENVDIDLDDIETGVDNLFSSGSAAGSISKYASDNGESIKSDYDLYIALNPSDSDTSGKLIGLHTGGTNVTSSKNESEAMTIKVAQSDGAYTVEYGIGAEKKTETFEPGEDLTLLIQSSERKDTSDVNGITLSIDNSSDMTLYVKVADDDTANRVKITSKAGSVIVYK